MAEQNSVVDFSLNKSLAQELVMRSKDSFLKLFQLTI